MERLEPGPDHSRYLHLLALVQLYRQVADLQRLHQHHLRRILKTKMAANLEPLRQVIAILDDKQKVTRAFFALAKLACIVPQTHIRTSATQAVKPMGLDHTRTGWVHFHPQPMLRLLDRPCFY